MPHFEEIKAYKPERRHGKTVTWLHTQVTASLVKLSGEGVIDLEQFFEHVRSQASGKV